MVWAMAEECERKSVGRVWGSLASMKTTAATPEPGAWCLLTWTAASSTWKGLRATSDFGAGMFTQRVFEGLTTGEEGSRSITMTTNSFLVSVLVCELYVALF
jgi:hypothetical protein